MAVSCSVVTDKEIPPGAVDGDTCKDNVGVVSLMVVADPRSDESPGGLPC